MNTVSTVKEVKYSGSSLAVYITRELNMMEVKRGDKVKVTLEKVE